MRKVVERIFYNSNLIVDLQLTGSAGTVSSILAKIDTGSQIGLALPASCRQAIVIPGGEVLKRLPCRLADGSTTIGEVYNMDAQLRCDDGSYWPEFPGIRTRTRAVILPRRDLALVGMELWGRWRIEIDGPTVGKDGPTVDPKGKFSIWVPDDC